MFNVHCNIIEKSCFILFSYVCDGALTGSAGNVIPYYVTGSTTKFQLHTCFEFVLLVVCGGVMWFDLILVHLTRASHVCNTYFSVTHYSDVIMRAMASQIIGVSIVFSTVCSGPDQRKHQTPAWLAFVRGIQQWQVNSPHKEPVTRKMFPFDDVIMSEAFTKAWVTEDK